MFTLDEVIATLEKLREEVGGDARFFMGDTKGGTRSIEKADLYDIAGIYRTGKSERAVIMYMVTSSVSLITQIKIQRARQTRARMIRVK